MRRNRHASDASGIVLVNRQKHYAVKSAALTAFTRELQQQLRLGTRGFNVCLVDDRAIRRLNSAFRGKDKATDVLSFPWNDGDAPEDRQHAGELKDFLGDVVISVETARRNARREGHSTLHEIRWLVLHGALHLLGYDHENDAGEMNALELKLRDRLGIAD